MLDTYPSTQILPTIRPTDAPTRGWARRLRFGHQTPGHQVIWLSDHQTIDHLIT